MDSLNYKRRNAYRRSHRVRSSVVGTTARPRLSVNISNLHITAQIIDDEKGVTLSYASTVGRKLESANLTQRAVLIGKEIAELAKKAKIKKVVFDRGSRKYHGRVKALADAARDSGMEF